VKKFKFRLAVVERDRELKEQAKRLELSKAIQGMQKAEAGLVALDHREVQARREFAALGSTDKNGEVNSSSFWILDQFIQGQRVRRFELKQILQDRETQVSHAYKDFLVARQQKKIMEKLRERREQEHKEQMQRLDKREQDDLYTMRHRLTKVGGKDEK
jgi:flagellar export protein FliJ